jgi:tetratricopeptide (TPR) repeat protein
MRTVVASAVCAVTALAIGAPSAAQAAWCANYMTGGSNCYFTTQQQCLAALSGIGGACNEIREGAPAQRAAPDRPRRTQKEGPRTKPREERSRSVRTTPSPPAASAPAASAPAAAVAPPAAAAAAGPTFGQALGSARQLVLNGQYDAGIAALRALNADGNPDVAAFLGLAHRKLGQTDAARGWYERALAADPNHRLTLSFYGMMHAETGAKDKALDMLGRLRRVCGGESCNEYRALQLVVAGGG